MDPRPPGIPGSTVWTKTAPKRFEFKPRMIDHKGEQEAKFVQDRITSAERNIAEFCHIFGAYSRKAARIRDKGDELSRVALSYAESEEINKSLSNGLANFANSMSTISDYADARVQNIDSKVINEFSQYESICKHVKEEVKQIFNVRSKEIIRKRQFDRAKERNPRNRQQIIQAEAELVRASTEVAKTIHNLEEQVTKFEQQKLHDVKNILLDFISTEMGYHAKCLELLTKAYQDVNRIDEDSDLEDFVKSLRMSDAGMKRSLFRSSQSLGSLTTVFSTPKRASTDKELTRDSRKTSRSEEILDSAKDEFDVSDEISSSSEEDDESEENSENSKAQEKISPFIARKFLK